MFVFIDTNILLSFYHYTSDDLDELKKLLEAIKHKRITLVLPQQVEQEFWRNREAKIADALSRLKDQKLNLQFPQICKDSTLYSPMREAQKTYEKYHGRLLNELKEAASQRTLKADEVVGELFLVSERYPSQPEIVSKAQHRISLGNPPGKNGSLGDAINWEILLANIPQANDLYLVSDDKDFRSPIDDTHFSQFLEREWRSTKSSCVHYYNKLSTFFANYYPNIKLATEKAIEELISKLAASGSFAQTHAVISQFGQFTEFTDDQLDRIAGAMLSNNQVSWIIKDEDVNQFACRIVNGLDARVNSTNIKLLNKTLEDVLDNSQTSSAFDDNPY